MASAFSHIAVPAVLYASFKRDTVNFKLFILATICSVIPDVDVIAFKFGIPYESQWGHRGFTHSLVFALSLSFLLTLFYRKLKSTSWAVFLLCFVSGASHALLDAMTNGGLGVALYWPFNLERIFLPFRPIQVSPIEVSSFFYRMGISCDRFRTHLGFVSCFSDWHYWCGIEAKIRKELKDLILDQN